MINLQTEIIDQDALCAIGKCKQKSRLIQWMNDRGIRYNYAANGDVWTTQQWLHESCAGAKSNEIEFS